MQTAFGSIVYAERRLLEGFVDSAAILLNGSCGLRSVTDDDPHLLAGALEVGRDR
jgi:hypothetical protein